MRLAARMFQKVKEEPILGAAALFAGERARSESDDWSSERSFSYNLQLKNKSAKRLPISMLTR
jgi:hypothetical protein